MDAFPTHVERIDPILCVTDVDRALRHYAAVLGFDAADWHVDGFTSVALQGCNIYLSERAQGRPGAWVWIGVGDLRVLHEHDLRLGARIRLSPTNYPWALEMQVEDPDGNVLRFGSDPD